MQCIYGEMAGTLELIQALPAELREKICKEYIIIRLWQRKLLGWDKVHQDLQKTPFCKRQQRLTIVTPWYKNEDGDFELLCVSCLRELLTAMKTMIPQDLKNTLIQPEEEEQEQQEEVDLTDMEEYDLTGSEKNKCQLTDAIQILPPEIREIIYKEYIKIKLRERADLGWDEVNAAIKEAPFCDHNQQIVKVLFCYKCGHCMRNYLCNLCKRNGVNHYLGYPIYDEDDYDECFKKYYKTSWCGAVA